MMTFRQSFIFMLWRSPPRSVVWQYAAPPSCIILSPRPLMKETSLSALAFSIPPVKTATPQATFPP